MSVLMGSLVGPAGRVYAFEPQKKLFRELVSNVKVNGLRQIVPLRYALGRRNAVVEMNPAGAGNEGGTCVGKGGDKVEMRTVDSFGFDRLDLIKIDVERLEGEVVDGAAQTITRTKPVILVEIIGGVGLFDANASDRAVIKDVVAKFNRLKYSVVWISGWDYRATPVGSYRYGQQLVFSKGGSAEGYLMGLWAGGEPWGRWSMDDTVGIEIVLPAPPQNDLVLTAIVAKYAAGKDHPRQVVDVYANDQLVDRWFFGASASADPQRVAIIPHDVVNQTYLRIGLAVRQQAAISAISNVDDRRVVGIGIEQMAIEEHDPMAAPAP
jgi:FkbM family methyltransferase